jgi:polyisoprenoid-binding protein YceI
MAWTVDPAHTVVGFSERHMGLSTVRGRFTRFRGEVDVDPADLTRASGTIEIDAASIDTGNPDRDAHLRSPDFFDVESHPVLTFRPTAIERSGDDEYRVTGELTIKGLSHPVTLRYEHAGEGVDPFGNRKLGGSLTGEIRRSDWGLTWNVTLEAGGWLVSDKIKIEVDGQLAETPAAVGEEEDLEREAGGITKAVDEVMKPSRAEQEASPRRER